MPDILPTDIVPATQPVAAAPAPAEEAPDELTSLIGQDGEIPEEVLRIPAFNALLEGKPGAIYAAQGEKSPELETIMKNSKELIKAGFGFYKADSKPVNVMFNALTITPQELAQADSEGRLDEVATPFSEVKASYDQLISEDQAKAGKTAAAAAPTVPGPSAPPPPASVQNKLATARTDNLTPGAPTSGPSPGQGRILNSLRKPVV